MTKLKKNTIFVTGYAKLPQGITATEMYEVIAVGVLIDKNTGTIEDVDCSLVTRVGKNFVNALVVGMSILDYEKIVEKFSERYHGSARKALLSAFKIVSEKYATLLKNEEIKDG